MQEIRWKDFLASESGLPYTLLILKGHKLNDTPIVDMTRLQILSYIAAYNIENKEKEKAARRMKQKGGRK
jgi:hypothetical protein